MFRDLQPIQESLSGIERWVTPLALGLRPSDYATLRGRLPLVIRLGPRLNAYHWSEEPDATTARRVVEQIGMLVLRLSEAGLLTSGAAPNAVDGSHGQDRPVTLVLGANFRTGRANQRAGFVRVTYPGQMAETIRLIIETPGMTFTHSKVKVTTTGRIDAPPHLATGSVLEIGVAGDPAQRVDVVVDELRFDVAPEVQVGAVRARIELVARDGSVHRAQLASVGTVLR